MATLITLIGLVLVLVGVGCGIVAYNRTRREHGADRCGRGHLGLLGA
jgi:hypothetical protein